MTLPPLPEMVVIDQHIPSGYAIRGYTSKEIYAYGKQCREAALEEAAKVCDAFQKANEDNGSYMWEAKNSAVAIRRLK